MATASNAEREIRKIAYALWMQEGQPEGRDREHWKAAKEIWNFRNREEELERAAEPLVEPIEAVQNQAVAPELTDQAERTNAPSRERARRLRS
jgi:hypothetical protein